MTLQRKHLVLLTACCLCLSASVAVSAKKKPAISREMDEQKRARHALNRLTFGPRPGEVERVAALGVDKWIDQQLHPERIDDRAIEARLAGFTTLRMSTREMIEKFPPPQVVKQVAEGKKDLPRDPKERAIYESQVDAYRDRQEKKQAKGDQDSNNPGMSDANADQRTAMREARMEADAKAQELLDLPADERFREILKMSPEERRTVARGLNQDDRQRVMQEFTPQQRETVMAMVNPQMVITTELQQAKVLRAIYSERQLDEVMADFWFNHFNVFMGKGPDRYLLTAYERDVIRPHALGRFRDLLEATAKSPAMLFYLDNWLSVGPHSDVATGRLQQRAGVYRRGPFGVPVYRPPRQQNPSAQQKKNKREGLNENYARELMELHTLSVSGGYSQKDVTEVAKVFTGWTIRQPRRGGGFEFNDRLHEPGPKYVLGKVIKEHGEKEGEQVLDMLAKSPKTAHFISLKLAQRFVSDDPPPALVDRMAVTFLKKDGDIREVLRTLFQSPEFWSPEAYRAKVKTPLEFVVSAVRASGVDAENAMPLVQNLNRMGMPLYGAQPPTGYSMKAETWVNSAALLSRMSFALALGTGRMRGLSFDASHILPAGQTPQDRLATLATLESALLDGDVSKNTHDTIVKQMDDPQVCWGGKSSGQTPVICPGPARPPNVGVLAGLLMGSPEFQRR
ncbi:MAG TPA: DUF1800 domain-containing protein [Terriglobales bacterium]|nr:DUF1800 domain-containing protein [Terriglobales bacterium]